MAGRLSTAVHEYIHRLQHDFPQLDDFFQDLHTRCTDGDSVKRLKNLQHGWGYGISKFTQYKYINPYQGKVYAGAGYIYLPEQAKRPGVMIMAFEAVLGAPPAELVRLARGDREMLNPSVGLLFNYAP